METDVEDLVTGLLSPRYIALDVADSKMYWTDFGADKIQRANLDGSNLEDLVPGLARPSGIALDIARGKMYWTDGYTGKIQRANLDGTHVEDIITGLTGLSNIVLDVAGGKMYWTDSGAGKIQRANLDGSNVQDLVTGLEDISGIVLALSSTPADAQIEVPPIVSEILHIYWTDSGTGKIQRANLDGSNVQDLVTGLESPEYIAFDVAFGKMYWTDSGAGKIQRANLDGSNLEDLITGLVQPRGIALDVVGRKMYWTDGFISAEKIRRAYLNGWGVENLVTRNLLFLVGIALDVVGRKMYWTAGGKIQRANLDGSGVHFVRGNLFAPEGIALDVVGGKMYWTDRGKIQRANLNGSGVENLVTESQIGEGIALDVAGGKMYWTDSGTGKIQRANLDGSNVQNLVTTGLDSPSGIALALVSTPILAVSEPEVEDVNRDGSVNPLDLLYIAKRYGQTGQNDADVNSDGIVNIDDIIQVAAVIESAAAAPSAHSQLPKELTAAAVNQWLTEAKLMAERTPAYYRGLLVLEHLLMVLTPQTTALLANYPNPFNPETWIPYQLAKAAVVTLTIYDINGAVVHQLALGYQQAGFYTERTKAAYWDGRNNLGEQVASGVYFYHLLAGSYSQTRRLVIVK